MTVRVLDAANYLCEKSGWNISNLHLHKFLYVADMTFTGQGKGRLVDEEFEAWDYGPVLPSLYHKCKAFGAGPVPFVFWGAKDISGCPEAEMLDLTWEKLKHEKLGRLVAVTHLSDGAWERRYVAGRGNGIITKEDMEREYQGNGKRILSHVS